MKKYPNGYKPKVEYYTRLLNNEVFNTKEIDINKVDYLMGKLDYFVKKELSRSIGSDVNEFYSNRIYS